jgi:hypothetical protein
MNDGKLTVEHMVLALADNPRWYSGMGSVSLHAQCRVMQVTKTDALGFSWYIGMCTAIHSSRAVLSSSEAGSLVNE